MQSEEEAENDENENTRSENTNSSIADVYKKLIMTENTGGSSSNGIEVFQNTNILKYSDKNVLGESGLPLMPKNPGQELEELINENKKNRKINKLPIKVLDAPLLQDDYYLNLIDWSNQNYLAVGLSSAVYLWNSMNSHVSKLCDIGPNDTVTSVAWSIKDCYFSMGTNNG